MSSSDNIEIEIKSWLSEILREDGATNISSVSVTGNSEKGDGYIGDIVFVNATATLEDGSTKEYKLVLKCSKRSQTLREQSQLKYIYLNEMFVYGEVLSSFVQFQMEKGIKEPFTSIPKFYGTFVGENIEVLVLENLKESGYELWPRKEPLTRKHVDLVIREYGKLHATAVAMNQQEPVKFQKIVDALEENVKFRTGMGTEMMDVFKGCILEASDLLEDELDKNAIKKWKAFAEDIQFGFAQFNNYKGVKVITHGDCWNNNFMYKYGNDKKIPSNVAFLDWQVTGYGSPIWDLSYFLFCCLSEDDFKYLNDILRDYHRSFTNHLKELGVEDRDEIYPFDKLLMDWKQYSKNGLALSGMIMKIISAEKNEIVDIEKEAERGKTFGESFMNEISNKTHFKNRMRPIVQYVTEQGLI